MSLISRLERARPGRVFVYSHAGMVHEAPDPADMDFQHVLLALDLRQVPGTPRMESWRRTRLFEAWSEHYDLPSYAAAQRLCWLVDHHADAIDFDLRHHVQADLRALWQARDWRRLLSLIDRLPRHSWFSESLSNDSEYAEMIREAMSSQESDGDAGPPTTPLHIWTPEVGMLAEVINAVHSLTYTLRAVNGDKTAKPPEPYPVPKTKLDSIQRRATHERRKAKHEALAARLLPHKRG